MTHQLQTGLAFIFFSRYLVSLFPLAIPVNHTTMTNELSTALAACNQPFRAQLEQRLSSSHKEILQFYLSIPTNTK
jgi:hypothetical protein